MANIHIKELFGSDNITALTEKVNFNFDQLILAGGGPEGPIGPTGNTGVAGPDGRRGSQWVAGFGPTTINLPTDGVYRKNDFLLNDGGSFVGGATGQVWYYNSTTWVDSGINLRGPKGDQGVRGMGAIEFLPGLLQGSSFVPNYTNTTTTSLQPTISDYITQIIPENDQDDYDKGGVGFINAGVDFAAIGYGNNSLVLGRYATLFPTGTSGTHLEPPTGVLPLIGFPIQESNVPMLLVSQNDYQDPSGLNNTYTNGISIGLTKSHPDADYTLNDGMRGIPANYSRYSNISIENKHDDLKIATGYQSLLTLSASSNSTFFRLGNTIARTGQTLDARSTKLQTEQYTNFKIENTFFTDLSDISNNTSGKEFITNAQTTFFQNKKFYASDIDGSTNNDTRKLIAKTFIGSEDELDGGANELVFVNGDSLTTDADGKKISRSIDPTTTGTTPSDFNKRSMFDSNNRDFAFRIGQTTVQPGRMIGVNSNGTPNIDSNFANKINITYQGQGYDTPFIQYSGIDLTNTYNGSISSGTYEGYAAYAVIPNDSALEKVLGYDIKDPIGFSSTENKSGSRSMSRMGIYPGFFRKDKTGNVYIGDADARQKKFFDVAHRMMPTGSLDVFGTVRIREQETTDNGAKDGWIVVNKKDGILGFQDPNAASGTVGTALFSIIMFPEMASNKFSFYVESRQKFGASSTAVGDGKAYNYTNTVVPLPTGGTGRNYPFAAFPGKGSDELQDYYMCNGAVLADSRDIVATGPFSKMKGMNISAQNGSSKIQNGTPVPTSGITDFDYEVNPDFIGIAGQTHITSPQIPASAGTWSDFVVKYFNDKGSLRNSGGAWGYSVLAGADADSKFRVVLPNYFGRVAKMQFPDSDLVVRAISGHKLSQDPGIAGAYNATGYANGQARNNGYVYYGTNNKYNASWMMKGMFDSTGFPYLSGSQTPKMAMPKHRHTTGGDDPLITDSHLEPNHSHGYRGFNDVRKDNSNNDQIGVKSRGNISTDPIDYAGDAAGGFTHSHSVSGKTNYTGDLAGGNPDVNDYDIDHYYITGTGFSNATFVLAPHFAYDVDGITGGGTYSNFSNWIKYSPNDNVDSSAGAVNGGKADISGQKFITPPFKGTIMAIYLKGLRNPNRGNSIITDLHFVGGVPTCGEPTSAITNADMSWYSDANSKRYSKVHSTSAIYSDGKFNTTTGAKTNEWWVDNFYEYGYQDMSRNDDTMHPYSFVDAIGQRNTSRLDYNTYSNTDSRKYTNMLYKSNITKENDFDVYS